VLAVVGNKIDLV